MDRASLALLHAAMRGALEASPVLAVVREWMIVERGGKGGTLHVLGLEAGDVWRRSSPITAREGAIARTESGRVYRLDGPPAGECWSAELRRGWDAMEAQGEALRRVE